MATKFGAKLAKNSMGRRRMSFATHDTRFYLLLLRRLDVYNPGVISQILCRQVKRFISPDGVRDADFHFFCPPNHYEAVLKNATRIFLSIRIRICHTGLFQPLNVHMRSEHNETRPEEQRELL